MIISDLDILEVVPEANQIKVNGARAWARAIARAQGRLTNTYTWKQTVTGPNFSNSSSSSSSSSSTFS